MRVPLRGNVRIAGSFRRFRPRDRALGLCFFLSGEAVRAYIPVLLIAFPFSGVL